ncbi:spindle assembly checkpoint component Mad1 [Phakopsora pachyrhizi]|uniref:Spindle assembly checkpoint component MAD1 n=1 Tax=Phakopsora pachyrhizi TaxID=170000 RepID=A0AAV0BHR2_PHAPC|nr:spindle assembly checkpoint component Mad1 [Phakopsora pachyrhizi]CAH7685488.1 spindle assembly checkpoint component Mad1 [Phakopsora pachyrhizi]
MESDLRDTGPSSVGPKSQREVLRRTSNNNQPSLDSNTSTTTRVLRNRSVSREPPETSQSIKLSEKVIDGIGSRHTLKRSLNRFENAQSESSAKRPVTLSRRQDSSNGLSTPASSRHLAPLPPSTIRSNKPSQSHSTLLAHDRARELSNQLEEAHNLITELERANRDSSDRELRLESKILDSERESRELLARFNERDARVRKLEQDRAMVESRLDVDERERQKLVEEAKEEVRRSRESEQSALENLQKLKEANSSLEQSARLLRHQQEQAQKLASAAEDRAQLLKDENSKALKEVEMLRSKLSEERLETEKLQQDRHKWQSTRGESTSSNTQQSRDVLKNELNRQLDRFKSLEQTNSRLSRELEYLRSRHSNAELLKEEIRNLKQRLVASDELRLRLATTEIELTKVLQEREEWSIFLGKQQSDFSNPHEFFKSLATTRIENASLKERLGSRQLEIKSRDRMIGELEAKLEEVEKDRDEEFKDKLRLQGELQIAGRNRDLDRRRIQMLGEQLKSYTIEEEAVSNGTTDFDKQKALKLIHLEELLTSHQNELAKAQKEADSLRRQLKASQSTEQEPEAQLESHISSGKSPAVKASLKEQIDRNEELETELDELSEENEMLKMELKSLELQVHHLERDLGRGEYNPASTQVLCPKGSPAQQDQAIRTATLEALRAENTALLKRLSKLEKGLQNSGGEIESLVPRETLAVSKKEIERLEAEVSKLTKARERLCEMYKNTTASYKRAMWDILGYSLEAVANGEFRLRSAFRDEPGATMLFVPGKADGCSMEYKPSSHHQFHQSSPVVDCFKTWLIERHSLPCFTAALTLKLYQSDS